MCSSDLTPSAHYHVLDVLVDGVSAGAAPSVTFTNVTANHTVAASFTLDTFALTTNVVGGGSVTPSPNATSYAYGTVVQLTANTAPGWAFGSWSGAAAGTASPINLTMDAAKSVTATFIDVTAPAVSLTSPVGGEVWDTGSVHAITWTATDNAVVDSVGIEYSATGPSGPWSTLAHGLANTGSWPWTLPSAASDSAYVRVRAVDHQGNIGSALNPSAFALHVPGVGVVTHAGPLALARPWPNPARGATTLGFTLPASGEARLEVLDVTGRVVWTQRETLAAGAHAWRWDGRDVNGAACSTGLYLVRLSTPFGTRHTRFAWVR